MTTPCEILFKVGNSGKYCDGAIISVKPPGVHIESHVLRDYLHDGVVVRAWNGMPRHVVKRVKRHCDTCKWWCQASLNEARRHHAAIEPDVFRRRQEGHVKAHRDMMTHGLDTVWGNKDLMIHAAVPALLTLEQIEIVTCSDDDDDAHPSEPRAVRKYRCYRVPYDTRYPKRLVDRWRDPEDRVNVPRDVPPITFADLAEIA